MDKLHHPDLNPDGRPHLPSHSQVSAEPSPLSDFFTNPKSISQLTYLIVFIVIIPDMAQGRKKFLYAPDGKLYNFQCAKPATPALSHVPLHSF
jgi:hypothetical protein